MNFDKLFVRIDKLYGYKLSFVAQIRNIKLNSIMRNIRQTEKAILIGHGTGSYEIEVYSTDFAGNLLQKSFSGEAHADSVDEYEIEVYSVRVYLPLIQRSP